MDIRNRRGLKLEAKAALEATSSSPKKLICIHTGASAALALVLALLDYLLQQQISNTGGLSGVGLRTILETAQAVLSYAELAALLFWQIGYVYIALQIGRGQTVQINSLLEGFRQFGPVLRLRLLTMLLYSGVIFAGVYLGTTVFALTPWAEPLLVAYQTGTETAIMAAMESLMLPMMAVVIPVLLILLVPYYYRLRMADYLLMDHPEMGAMMAIRISRLMMRGNRLHLMKLDMSFWWFYVLELMTVLVGYGDLLLPMFGIRLPWSGTMSYFVFLALFYVSQLALYWWRGNEVRVTYALAYEALLPKETEKDCT
jgi:uncharacterized membrane protein